MPFSIYGGLALLLCLSNHALEHVDTRREGAEETFLLFLHHAANEYLLSFEFGEGFTHFFNKGWHELTEKGFALAEERKRSARHDARCGESRSLPLHWKAAVRRQ